MAAVTPTVETETVLFSWTCPEPFFGPAPVVALDNATLTSVVEVRPCAPAMIPTEP